MLSNAEQLANISAVKRRVKDSIELGVGYLDLVSIHSPLTDRDRRLGTYHAFLGFVRAVGLLKEIEEYVREDDLLLGVDDHSENLPALNQLELSPFNAHSDVVQYCGANGIAVGCAAWSKLSGVDVVRPRGGRRSRTLPRSRARRRHRSWCGGHCRKGTSACPDWDVRQSWKGSRSPRIVTAVSILQGLLRLC